MLRDPATSRTAAVASTNQACDFAHQCSDQAHSPRDWCAPRDVVRAVPHLAEIELDTESRFMLVCSEHLPMIG
jgi:hypothetical protein